VLAPSHTRGQGEADRHGADIHLVMLAAVTRVSRRHREEVLSSDVAGVRRRLHTLRAHFMASWACGAVGWPTTGRACCSLFALSASTVHASETHVDDASPAHHAQADDAGGGELGAQSTAVSWTGVFRGTLQSNGVRVPATTELLEHDGVISGRDSFADKSGSTEGTLSQCARLRIRAIRCTWQDSYGTGDLELTLSKDGTTIVGRWRAANGSRWYEWNGTR